MSTGDMHDPGVPASIGGIRLPVHVVLGRVTRTLAEIYQLDTGSLLEMDRSPSEPVEVVVNGRVIAWGELVVSRGNYAVRITRKAEEQETA